MKPLRVGVIGAGQVWRRLYAPALERTAGFNIGAIADPVPAPGVTVSSVHELLGEALDCALVLSPPAFHAEHVLACLERGLPVLVEKPAATATSEVEAWEQAGGANLVRPAFSRRYWPAYRQGGRNGHQWDFRLHTNPAEWGATSADPVAFDLLPHAADLASWVSGEGIASVKVFERSETRLRGAFQLGGGGRFAWDVAHTTTYLEELRMDGNATARTEGLASRIGRRLSRRPDPPVQAIMEMLDDWVLALAGATPPRLGTFTDARTNAAIIEQVLTSPIEDST